MKEKVRFRRWWRDNRWMVMLLGAIIVFALGIWGFWEVSIDMSIFNVIYSTLRLFVLNFDGSALSFSLKLEIARWLAVIISVFTAYNALVVVFREQWQLLRIRLQEDHIVICGLGNKGLLLARKFHEDGKKVVVIEKDLLNGYIEECRDSGIIVLTGDARNPHMLVKAGLVKASVLFAVCENEGINAEIAMPVRHLTAGKRNKPLTCKLHIMDHQLCFLLKEQEFAPENADEMTADFRLEFLNLFDHAAQLLVDEYFHPALPSHIVIVGVGGLGERLVVQAAKKWKESDQTGKESKKLKISLIDRDAKEKTELLYFRYPNLDTVCELVPHQMEIKSGGFEKGPFLDDNEKGRPGLVYVCLDNDSLSLSTALSLHQRLRGRDIPVVMRMERRVGLAGLVQSRVGATSGLHSFGLLDSVLKSDLLLSGTNELIASIIHREYCNERLKKNENSSINPSLRPWDELAEDLKESNRRQAHMMGVKLKSVDCYIVPITEWAVEPIEFSPEEIELMAEIEHNHWWTERKKSGWRHSPGPKNAEQKTSPFMVPWSQLPDEEKEKDRDTVRQMPAHLEKAGFQIYRWVK